MPIVLEGLTHIYMPGSPFQSTALHNVNLAIRDGEFVGLIGHTGSGKSTLVQHLNGLLKPTQGRVLVDGIDVNAKTTERREIRRRVGLVFQYPEHQLFEESVYKDVAFGPHNLGLGSDEIHGRVLAACARVGIPEEMLDRSPFELSGGQKRRVAIAGVLAMQPRVLIVDEPTAGLDPRGREEILGILRELHAVDRVTLVMVSHSMDDIARLCTRIFVMNRGELAMVGTPKQVFAHSAKLTDMGLGLPAASYLAQKLRDSGFDIPTDVYQMEELRAHILSAYREGKADA